MTNDGSAPQACSATVVIDVVVVLPWVPAIATVRYPSMSEASAYVEVLQKRTGTVIGSPEVAAFREGFIDATALEELAEPMLKSGYGRYLIDAARD